ncbi:glycosyltransferase family 4 protein [Nafulsella turpanensis]|uniref:glycosyltransferase family 4 protein n=1 Tax=Nafulsella turpanensis TaxID=1265690 RepID=UPI0003494C78|nr:glycosyltransferase family 4 protein [Nafulsella turpanensis]
MRVAIVTTGLLDSLLPLAKYLSKKVSLDIYVSLYGQKYVESVGVFDLSGLQEGMNSEEQSARVLGPELQQYIKESKGRIRLKLFKYPNLKIFNRRNFQLHRQFARELNREQYDVVHLNGYRGAQMFLYGFLKRSVAKVWTVHDPILHSGEDKWQTRLAYRSYRFLKAHFILHNKQQMPLFIQKYKVKPSRCHFVAFGPLEIFKAFKKGEPKARQDKMVLFWGRISPYKGVEYLIEAGKIAKQKVQGLKIVIAGKPNYHLDTSAIEQDPTFEHINGFVENPQLVDLLEQSALVVCPYTDATQSGVLMTAYAFNKPVLATAVGGLPEVIEEGRTGRLVPPKDSQALADAIVEMIENPTELKNMSRNIEALSQDGRFSWDTIAQETLEVYQQAIKEK